MTLRDKIMAIEPVNGWGADTTINRAWADGFQEAKRLASIVVDQNAPAWLGLVKAIEEALYNHGDIGCSACQNKIDAALLVAEEQLGD